MKESGELDQVVVIVSILFIAVSIIMTLFIQWLSIS